jgi:hypothetical protein
MLLKILPFLLMLTLALGADYEVTITKLPENPHEYMNEEGKCFDCHASYLGEVDPHVLEIDIVDSCLQEKCHQAFESQMKRSHPVRVDPYRSKWDIEEVPEALPLHEGEVSCGTCHNPHMERLSRSKSSPWDIPAYYLLESKGGQLVKTSYYYTYFLRISDARFSYEKLCVSCHII